MFILVFVTLVGVNLQVSSMGKKTDSPGFIYNLVSGAGPIFSPEIFDAIKNDDLETVGNIVLGVKSGVKFNFNVLNSDGENVLYFACAENKARIAKFLIENGAKDLVNIYILHLDRI